MPKIGGSVKCPFCKRIILVEIIEFHLKQHG